VQVQVEYRLAVAGAVVDGKAEGIAAAGLRGELRGGQQEVAEQGLVLGGGVGKLRDGLARNQQQVRRRAGIDVLERHAVRILVHDRGRQLPVDDLLEQRLGHGALRQWIRGDFRRNRRGLRPFSRNMGGCLTGRR
jgi:hypothetical protein